MNRDISRMGKIVLITGATLGLIAAGCELDTGGLGLGSGSSTSSGSGGEASSVTSSESSTGSGESGGAGGSGTGGAGSVTSSVGSGGSGGAGGSGPSTSSASSSSSSSGSGGSGPLGCLLPITKLSTASGSGTNFLVSHLDSGEALVEKYQPGVNGPWLYQLPAGSLGPLVMAIDASGSVNVVPLDSQNQTVELVYIGVDKAQLQSGLTGQALLKEMIRQERCLVNLQPVPVDCSGLIPGAFTSVNPVNKELKEGAGQYLVEASCP